MAFLGQSGTNLKLLRAFDAVARHLSFRKAATELSRSESTISVQVRDLERQLDVRLLDRTTRRVALTDAGGALAAATAAGFRAIDTGLQAARDLADGRKSRIVLACVPSLSASRLPAILASYRLRDKTTRIDVEELSSPEILVALREGVVDFGVGPCTEPPPPDIAFTAVVDDPLVVLLPGDQSREWADGVPLEALTRMPLVTLSGSVLLHRTLEAVAGPLGLKLNSHAEVRHVATAIAMTRAGIGAAIVPRLSLPDRPDADLHVAPIVEPTISRRVGVMARAGQPLAAGAARLARHVRSALGHALDAIDAERG